MTKTEFLYRMFKKYRDGIKAIQAEYDNNVAGIERFKGSQGYEDKKAEYKQKQTDAVTALRKEVQPTFDSILSDMRNTVNSRKMGVPSEEELRLLQTLKMREKVSRDELIQAAQTLGNTAVSLAVLDEIAAKNGFPSLSQYYQAPSMGTDKAGVYLDKIRTDIIGILSIEKPNHTAEYFAQRHAAQYGTNDSDIVPDMSALKKVQYDFDVESEDDLLNHLISTDKHERILFCKAVNEGK